MFEGIFQPTHLLVILIIALLIFGPGKIAEIGGSLGKAIRDFKNAMNEQEKESDEKAKRIAEKQDKTK